MNDLCCFLVGRAGRYGSKFPDGEVTCLHANDLPLLHSSLDCPSPTLEVIELLFKCPIKYLPFVILGEISSECYITFSSHINNSCFNMLDKDYGF